jgi:7-cyano-7-deazaguanine synthase
MSSLAIVLLSGGLDSTVTTAVAAQKHDLALLHVNYGQKTENRELTAFNAIAEYYNVNQRLYVNIESLKLIGGSSLTDDNAKIISSGLRKNEIPSTYVPFRNTHLISAAVSWAEVIGANYIYIGAVEEDSSGYPDCRKSYFDTFNELIEKGTKPETDIRLVTPVIDMSKSEIVKKGKELNAPLQLTWSCYKEATTACGVCDSCILRLRAFKKVNFKDPINYKYIPPEFIVE